MSVYIRACRILAFESGKGELPSANFQLGKEQLKEWSVNLVNTKGQNLQRSFANEHWTEAEANSDRQVESLMNVAEFKANFMGKLSYY